MNSGTDFSLLDVFDLPDLHREIVLYLARSGPADATTLVQADGRADAVLGRVESRTTLPAQLWNALLATDRLYSIQDFATLRTAVPILQAARARLVEFVGHDPGHAPRVKSFASQLGHITEPAQTEQQLLRAGALFHDVSDVLDRKRHNVISQETVIRLTTDGELPFSVREAEVVGLLRRWHRREYDPDPRHDLNGETIRTGLLASILRVADAIDIDHRRSDYTDRSSRVLHWFFPQQC